MNLEKLLWSGTKVDILKYLVFRKQWISIRSLESDLNKWSFPAIKKQVDILVEAKILNVDKSWWKWAIYIDETINQLVKRIFMYSLEYDVSDLFLKYDYSITDFFLWKIFWNDIDSDIVVIYTNLERPAIEKIKEEINEIFVKYYIDSISMTFLSKQDFDRRYRLADKFVLNLMSYKK